jgi:hypothetical protein
LRLRCCGQQRQDAVETKPLNGFLVRNTSSSELFAKGGKNTKKSVLLLAIAFAVCLPLGAKAQNPDSARKPANFSAKVAGNGKTLIADKDNKIWLVSNPETLSGIEGRHVKVKALVDVAQSQIRIVSVSAIADEQAAMTLHDAAFRR